MYPTFTPSVEECQYPVMKSLSVVRFTNSAKALIQYESSFPVSINVVNNSNLSVANLSDNVTLASPLHKITIESLNKNDSYTVYATNSCGITFQMATFDTKLPNTDIISVSDAVFKETADFLAYNSNSSIYDYFVSNTKLEWLEKLSFLQRYIYKDQELTVLNPGAYPPPPPPSGKNCNCSVISSNPFPSYGTRIGVDFGPITESNNDITVKINGLKIPIRVDRAKGAAKFQGHGISVSCSKRESSWSAGGGSTINSPYFDRVSLLWTCTNSTGYPSEEGVCPCKKSIELKARYDSKLRVKTKTPFSLTCLGDKGGTAQVEDHAILYVGDQKGNIKVLAAGKAMISADCSYSINRDFFIELLDLVGIAAKIYFVQVDTNILKRDSFQKNIIDQLVKETKDLIKTPFAKRYACGNYEKDTTLIDTYNTLEIVPNLPVYTYLASASYHYARGYTSFEGRSEIHSNVSIGERVYKGVPNGQPLECCSDGISTWIGSSMYESPWTQSQVNADLNDWFSLAQFPYNNNEWGRISISKVNCDPFAGDNTNDRNLSNKILTTNYSYHIYDVAGRLLIQGNDVSGTNLLEKFNQSTSNFQSGIYFMEVNAGSEKKTYKFIKSNEK